MGTPEFPPWAQSVANAYKAVELQFLAMKTIEALDISMEHNCIRVPFVAISILHEYLTPKERKRVDNFNVEDEDYTASNARWLNKGLNVLAFIPDRRLELQLTNWDGFAYATNIKGIDLLKFQVALEVGDNVAVWMFRGQDEDTKEKLCFIFHKL